MLMVGFLGDFYGPRHRGRAGRGIRGGRAVITELLHPTGSSARHHPDADTRSWSRQCSPGLTATANQALPKEDS